MEPVVHHAGSAAPGEPLEYSTEDGSLRVLGFWVFLAAEFILFSCLFATYVVMHPMTAGGPSSKELYDVPGFAWETFFLLTSSFTCGIATFEMRRGNKKGVIAWMLLTIALGLCFLGFEISEFVDDVQHGASMSTSGFLSSFFTLVGTHGAHVSMGILWMTSVVIQIAVRGIDSMTSRKMFIVSLYWHFLDVVWIFIFTVVYLTGKVL
ncbi:cytochrome aa3 quinol oxidase subunit III [Alicyclobacillus cycloheptanicus]|uniref:Quinol oxidase subunit 3 n=1 Tax=Alicyclobacillus cycloheptanicus TaxID=1457 RepID=A0ABT9XHE1_9BACL|nr:cytochrome aa3 quinol oxidase subunit III [Alicyclobacillus cycloheptanicus]MDQ0189728.1 cytochrome aa3-600 menaquinol oxidase subunit 3 [Alicyclobacillus cycloheptanicus]WDM01939.1 cytochrome aa3 quinol oxidase subunit III [Alicyclobacillus cycloheptanicus]